MDVAIIDYYAIHGTSFLHRAKAFCKVLFTALLIASIVITGNIYVLLGIYLVLFSLCLWTRLPFFKIVMIAAYPAIFALLFVIASWNGSWTRGGVIMLKALSSALTMVILIVTTPYPEIFSSIRPLLPKIIVEALFVTYRSLFILLELTDGLIKGLKIRGGLKKKSYINNIKNFSFGIGLLIVRGIDMSEKFYGVMNIRGYNGNIAANEGGSKISYDDTLTVLVGALVFAVSLGIRIEPALWIYVLYIPIISAVIFVLSTIYVIQSDF